MDGIVFGINFYKFAVLMKIAKPNIEPPSDDPLLSWIGSVFEGSQNLI